MLLDAKTRPAFITPQFILPFTVRPFAVTHISSHVILHDEAIDVQVRRPLLLKLPLLTPLFITINPSPPVA